MKQELERIETLGVIAKVEQPTEWCAGMVVVPKANGKVRICVDLTILNESVQRECHPLPAVDQTLAQLAGAKVFSKLDVNSEFWQIPLDPASALLMTFITPFGCFVSTVYHSGSHQHPSIFNVECHRFWLGSPVSCV